MNLFKDLINAQFKPITFRLYNMIDDDMIPYSFGKKNNEHYGIDDFEYFTFPLEKNEKFLLSLHNKDMMNSIKLLKAKLKDKDCVVHVNCNEGEISVIKLVNENLSD